MRTLTRLILPAMLVLAACSAPQTAADSSTGIEVRDAFIVQPPEGRDVTGGGLHVSVTGSPRTLIRASSPIAEKVEMHTMSMDEDVMKMRQVESFPVTETSPLVMERGGNHLMLFGVSPLQLGEQVDVILTFTDESGTEEQVTAKAEVVPPAG